ncbi:MAG: helix-turn-helix transcriptional regulator, partial [Ensifer sp. SSB1]|nr:helix-turn-helix transcriptional regulator [Ensifer sp. SSB1]
MDDEQKLARQGNRAARAATLVTRLQAMQRQINAKHFAVLRLNGKGTARKLTCVLDNWGLSAEANAHDLVSTYGEELIAHLDRSLLPVLWNGAGEHQAAEVFDLAPFAHRLKARKLSFSGIAFPVRLGAQGNGYVIFAGNYVDASTEQVVDLHGRSCMIMTDLL